MGDIAQLAPEIREVIDLIDSLDAGNQKLKDAIALSLNPDYENNLSQIFFHIKYVFPTLDNQIFRVESILPFRERLAFMNTTQLPIFAEEIPIEINTNFGKSLQPKLNTWHYLEEELPDIPEEMGGPINFPYRSEFTILLSQKIYKDYPNDYTHIKEILEFYSINGVHDKNVGVTEDNKIKVYDFFGNFIVDENETIKPDFIRG